VVSSCEYGNEPSGFTKDGRFSTIGAISSVLKEKSRARSCLF
jgi:hypothetical protein